MIKKLLTRNTIPLQKIWIVASLLILTLTAYSQTTSLTETCRCLNNQDYEEGQNGQFSTTLEISSLAGESWSITTPSGIYLPSSVYPNAAIPITDGTMIAETATPGIYELTFVFIDSLAFSFNITNGTYVETFTSDFGTASSSFFSCRYARAAISGEDFVCTSSTERYEVTNDQNATFSWSVSGGGVVSSTTNTSNVVEIDWGITPGTYQVQVVASVPIPRCSEINTFTVVVEDIVALACNNNVNLSMNNSCELNVLPSMILEDMEYVDDSYTIELYDEEAEVIVPNDILGDDYIGKQLKVTVTQQCGNNSCWGYVTIEDKSVVDIVCPADITINCDQLTSVTITGLPDTAPTVPVLQADGTYLLTGYDNCGDAYLSYSDTSVLTDCTSATSSIVTRTWVITDETGNSKSCTQSISINRATLADVVFPPNFDSAFDQTIHQPSLQACGSDASAAAADAWIALTNGNPSPETTGYPIGTSCLGLDLTYVDVKTKICGDKSYKIQRTWAVAEECTGLVEYRVQLITVMDTNPPVIVAPEEFDFPTDTHICGGDILIPAPIFTYECSEWDYTVGYKVVDDSNNPYLNTLEDGVVRDPITGLYTINNISSVTDMVWIVYTATDECGNSSQAFTEITVIDDEQPIPVCDLYTFVALNDEGIAYAGIETFDDGSWDNCGVDYIRINRMTSNGCPQPSGGELVKFCCRDVGTTQMVQLTVYDLAGNSNSCMVEVEIQDNQAPVITCPPNVTIDCSAQLTNLSQYGSATAEDVCNATITETSSQLIDGCTKGSITRVFTATDAAGNSSSCTQTITVSNLDPFYINTNNSNDPSDDVVWPLDLTIIGCAESNIDADELESQYGYPTTTAQNCSSIAVTYEDVVFQYVDGACYKVLRTWTIVDWCQYNPFTPGVGQWSYTQVIKILNNTAPVITNGCSDNDFTVNSSSTCSANVSFTSAGTDDCTSAEDLSWSYTIDENNDGSTQYSGVSNSTTRNLDFGTHKICWTLSDDCGNDDECCHVFTLEDTKAPTPYCLDAIVSVLNPVDEQVKIWASDFNNGASDNCDNAVDVRVSFSSNVNDISRTYTCGDITNGIVDTFEVDIWFTDLSGNQDFCTSKFILQDNHDICTDILTPNTLRVAVAGAVFTEDDKMVNDVSMMLMDENIQSPQYQMTSLTGEYAFQDLNMYGDFMLEPTKDTDYMNGVSTLDLVIMQKHILGIQSLDSPYKMIAADINSSESISAVDLIQLRKLILGIYDELPNNQSYRFVDAAQQFDDVTQPFPFKENKELLDVESDMSDNDFIAVKIGDVNGSLSFTAQSGSIENRNDINVALVADDQVFTDRETVTVDFKLAKDISAPGFQLTLDINDQQLELMGVSSNTIKLNDANIAYHDNVYGNDKLIISWSEANAHDFKAGDAVMTASFKALNAGSLSDANTISIFETDLIKSEIYTTANGGYITQNVTLEIGAGSTSDEFTLYQNVPNPFDQSTIIGFNILQDEDVTLRIFDTTGRAIYTQAGRYAKGYNEINIQTESIKQKGILYYQLETKTHIASKKMIVID